MVHPLTRKNDHTSCGIRVPVVNIAFSETPEELKPQFALIREATDAFCLPSLELDDPAAKIWHELAAWAGSSGTEQLLVDIGGVLDSLHAHFSSSRKT